MSEQEEDPTENMRKLVEDMLQGAEISALASACMHMHEMFLGLQAGGFSEKQALYIISMALLGSPSNGDVE